MSIFSHFFYWTVFLHGFSSLASALAHLSIGKSVGMSLSALLADIISLPFWHIAEWYTPLLKPGAFLNISVSKLPSSSTYVCDQHICYPSQNALDYLLR